MSKKGLNDAQFAGKIKTMAFKQFQLERLLKGSTVIPASKLAEAKELGLLRSRDFEASRGDEERHRRIAIPAQNDKLENLPMTLFTILGSNSQRNDLI